MQDDGCGMSEKTLREMLGGLGYTDKDSESTGKHYGMGSKTGLMRMSPQGVLVFTVKDGNWAVGLLSTTLSEELGLSQECVFFCSWDAATREKHRIKNHKLIKTAPTPGRQKATPASPPYKACTSFYGTASRTSGTRRSSSGRPCTSNISGTGLASFRRRDILFPFAAMAPKARRRRAVAPPRPVELE